eukprot:gene27299-35868_t
MATSNNVEALSNLSSTAGIDLVALRRKYLAVKENSETSSSHEINRENKFENIDKSAAASLDDYVICKSCLGKGTVNSVYNKCIVVERECEECDGNSILLRKVMAINMETCS